LLLHYLEALHCNAAKSCSTINRALQRRNRRVPLLPAGLASALGVHNPRCPVARRYPIMLPCPVCSCSLPGPR
jgi:hypothetical protein